MYIYNALPFHIFKDTEVNELWRRMSRLRIFPGVSQTQYVCVRKHKYTKVCASIHKYTYTGMQVDLGVWYMNRHVAEKDAGGPVLPESCHFRWRRTGKETEVSDLPGENEQP